MGRVNENRCIIQIQMAVGLTALVLKNPNKPEPVIRRCNAVSGYEKFRIKIQHENRLDLRLIPQIFYPSAESGVGGAGK